MRQHKIFSSLLAFDRWIIGVNDKMKENVWRYDSGGTIPFNLPWSSGSPSNSNGNEDCVEVHDDKKWNDIPCTTSTGSSGSSLRPSICENAAAIECLSLGHSYTYVLGKCYYVEIDFFNYADAMDNCQNHFGSGNSGKLFEPRDAASNDQVIEFAARTILPSTNQKIYIGMNDLAKEGTFHYATGGDLVYTNWHSGEPNNSGEQRCVAKRTRHHLFCRIVFTDAKFCTTYSTYILIVHQQDDTYLNVPKLINVTLSFFQ